MLYGNENDAISTGNGEKRNDQYVSNVNGNKEAFSNKKSDHNSWWNSQSSSSRFSSPAYKNEPKNFMKNGGRPTLNTERGKKFVCISYFDGNIIPLVRIYLQLN